VIARDAANLLHVVTRLEVASTRRAVATNIEVANSFGRRFRGLIGRSGLETGEALLFERARQVHTFGMRFPIDVVFCDRDWRVVHVVPGLRPRRITRFVWSAYRVVELREGGAAELRVGERLAAL
jgi:uncharacterized membrane protein (UPF0127 family)